MMPIRLAHTVHLLALAALLAASQARAEHHESGDDAVRGASAPQMSMGDFLGAAISRGVPLFNAGQPEACAAVYATALEAVAHAGDWGLAADQRTALAYQLDLHAALGDPSERAWAYRRLIDALLNGESIAMPETADALTLFDFATSDEAGRWRVVVDGVMGGRSTGRLAQQDDALVFSGETSLANNGGFSSIRAPVPAGSVAGYDSLRIRVMGDGRTWILGASSSTGRRGDSYWTRFETRAGEWQTVTVPVSEMVRQFFGTPMTGRLQPAAIRGIEFYMYDKQAGPFQLLIDRIEAVRSKS
jgi:NADH dehydrogenase [ubiquinone] 1 alpha subcomplex assembly factor 1